MENNYFALLANDVKKLWNGLDDGQKLGMLALIVVTIIAATFFLSKAMEPDWVVLYSDLNEVNALTIVDNMKKNGYQYKLSEDKKSVLVPSNVRDEMRVFVAENDFEELSKMIQETCRISFENFYPKEWIEYTISRQTIERLKDKANKLSFYVAKDKNEIVGCGAIGDYYGKEDESCLFSFLSGICSASQSLKKFFI